MHVPYWIDPDEQDLDFPDVEHAMQDPDGLLAMGGDLSPQRLIHAYRHGIFPWYSSGQPILWWSPDPRSVLFPAELKVSHSLTKKLRRKDYLVTMDQAFEDVLAACAKPRKGDNGTWITPEMAAAYTELHAMGIAHSIETWQEGRLAGGLYGVSIGKIFYGESMFAQQPDASKVAFVHLVRQFETWGFPLIDCQVHSEHLASLGARTIRRPQVINILQQGCSSNAPVSPWKFDPGLKI